MGLAYMSLDYQNLADTLGLPKETQILGVIDNRLQGGIQITVWQDDIPRNSDARVQEKCIELYRFYDAPEKLRALSTHGGDEDYLAVVPPGFGMLPDFLTEDGTWFGVSGTLAYDHPTKEGYVVYIGAHA